MQDLMVIVGSLVFFVVAFGYIALCDRLMS